MPPCAINSSCVPVSPDAALVEHHDLVGAADGGQPVRDHDHGAVLHQVGQRLLHQHFRFGVEMRGGFVQNQDGRVLEQGAGDGDALPLAAAQPHAAVADHRLVAFRQALDEFVRQGGFGGAADALRAGYPAGRRRCCALPCR